MKVNGGKFLLLSFGMELAIFSERQFCYILKILLYDLFDPFFTRSILNIYLLLVKAYTKFC